MHYSEKFRSLYLQTAGKLTQSSDFSKIVFSQLVKVLPESANVYEYKNNGSKVKFLFTV